jgi:hypothetical protein
VETWNTVSRRGEVLDWAELPDDVVICLAHGYHPKVRKAVAVFFTSRKYRDVWQDATAYAHGRNAIAMGCRWGLRHVPSLVSNFPARRTESCYCNPSPKKLSPLTWAASGR